MDILEMIANGDKIVVHAMEYNVCSRCRHVGTDLGMITVGQPCPACGVPLEGGSCFFDVSILTVIDLLQESFIAIPAAKGGRLAYDSTPERAHSAAVVTGFCTIKEILVERFLRALMEAQQIPENVQFRLLADNSTHIQRLTKLFPSLLGLTWQEALQKVEPTPGEFAAVDDFLPKISKIRNEFIHDGADYNIDKDLADECLRQLFPMLRLFVALNKQFVHPLMLARGSSS